MKKRLQNFWYYYKVHTIIILTVLAALLYFFWAQKDTVKSDYSAAIVSPRGCTEEQLTMIRTALEQAGKDQNGDGAVTATVRIYRFAIGKDGQDRTEIAKLDADLVGKESGLFFTDDPEQFEVSTNGIGKAADAIPVSEIPLFSGCGIDDLFLLRRSDMDEKYNSLLSALSE